MKPVLLVGVFGAAGAIARFLVSAWLLKLLGDRFPWGTCAVNVVGCALIGVLFEVDRSLHWLSQEWRAGLAAGFLGGLTTFSTFGLDTVRLVELQRPGTALVNILTNLLFGLLAVWLGMVVVRRLYLNG